MAMLEEQDQIERDFYADLVDHGLETENAQSIVESSTDESLEDLIGVLDNYRDQVLTTEAEPEGIIIPCDNGLRDYFWKKVQQRLDDENAPEETETEVIFHILNSL